jgi:hypothetical protein
MNQFIIELISPRVRIFVFVGHEHERQSLLTLSGL